VKKLASWAWCLILCLLPAALLLGQETTGNGSVTGRVSDPTGASVPGATVSLIDESTNIPITIQSNASGLYAFNDVTPGKYDLVVTKPGFRKSVVAGQDVTTGANLTLDVGLEVGATSETVEVKEVAGAELQTENATMGTALGGNAILQLPTISRDVSSLVFLQATAAPTFNGAEGNTTSGNIAGNFADQNTFMLDGGNNTSDLDGDNATYVARNGSGVMPTPAESVEEFRVNTNNQAADFSMSGGGQVMVSTKRGTNTFHGAAYDFFQSDWLNSNDWFNNFQGIAKPKAHFNRFGGALGGPLTPEVLGGKTYFYMNYEGQRYPRSGPFTALVPSATLRQGIIEERDGNGNIVQYNLATSTACGPTGGMACDPLGIGLNPVVSNIWNKYEPACNDFAYGDHLNTCGYNGNLTFPLSNDFGVVRIDHDFGSKWRFFSAYRIYKNVNPTTNQVDVGGVLPGDTLGNPAVASTDIQQPRSLVVGITGTLSPTLTNEFHFSYLRNQWQWLRAGAVADFGFPGSVEIGGEQSAGNGLSPLNVNTQDARQRLWDGHDFEYRDSVSKLWGTHLIQAGGDFFHEHWHFDRYDDVGLGLTSLVYDVSNASNNINFTPAFQPIPCGATQTANCLPSSELGDWNNLYAQMAGLVEASSIVVTRTGANLTANPLGTPVRSYVTDETWSLFFNDTWKIKPNFTLAYGLNYQVQMPPIDANQEQDILTLANGQPIDAQQYLAARLTAANAGQVYNPTLAFTPIGDVKGLTYPYKPYWGEIAPRVSIAWSPEVSGGWLHSLLGDKATVIRVGYGRFYSRNLGINLVSTPVLGDGFLQPVGCVDPLSDGTCTSPGGSTPANGFRIGVNGTPPVGAITPTLTVPVEPGENTAYAARTFTLDRDFQPANSDSVDFTIQRQFKGNTILELGYVGVYSRHLFQGVDLNDVPWMMKYGGQTFANAFDNLYLASAKGATPAPQPFLEAALAGSAYCKGYSTCTAAVAAQEAGNISTLSMTNLWSDLDNSFVFGPALISTNQAGFLYDDTSMGYSNYNAGVVTLQKRSTNTNIVANFTWAKALGIIGLNQAYTENNVNDPWNLGVDYGPQFYDRKFTFNLLGSYNLPFGKGQRWLNGNGILDRIVGGWIISPIFSYGSGLPLSVYNNEYSSTDQNFGNGYIGNGCNAVPLTNTGYSNSPVFNSVTNPTIGANGQAANGGSGVNLFGNPAAIYNNFRPTLPGIDGTCGGGGILRGQQRWNLDLGLTKDTRITERIGIQIYAQAFNVFNHMMFQDPFLSLQDPADFGVLGPNGVGYSGQYNALGLGGNGATGEYTRIIQLGVRLRF
jgi:Carboxypeptidase regulatory-like domain